MKLGLIAMSGVRLKSKKLDDYGITLPGFVQRKKTIASLPSLALLALASVTPKDFEIDYKEIDNPEDFLNSRTIPKYDIVGISSYTAQILEAYKVADRFRTEGVTVVMGGLHATTLPMEAIEHADSVVIGEGEPVWGNLLEDFKKGKLKRFYGIDANGHFDLSKTLVPAFDLLDMDNYNRITIQTSRGCPHDCFFCASSKVLGSNFRQKPADLVMRELDAVAERWPHPFIEFADDNTFVNRQWSREFLQGLLRRKIKWFTETDISIAYKDDLLDMLLESGCRQLLIGFESPDKNNLHGMDKDNWKLKWRDRYLEAIDRIQSRGVPIIGCFLIGLDGDTTDTFEKIRDFVLESNVLDVQITVPTPFPGTRFYHKLKKEGRLLKNIFWDSCTLFDVNYRPKNMSPEELDDGMLWLFKELYSDSMVARRKQRFRKITREVLSG